MRVFTILFCLVLSAFSPHAEAQNETVELTLYWQHDGACDGYRLYMAESSQGYSFTPQEALLELDAGARRTTFDVNVYHGQELFFVVTAYIGINESGPSNEAVYTHGNGIDDPFPAVPGGLSVVSARKKF